MVYGDLYHAWMSQIDEESIKTNVDDLIFISPASKLHELADLIGLRKEREKASEAYVLNLAKLNEKSDWEYVRESADKSDLLSLNDELIFKESLLLRLEIKYWMEWVDNLKWPILQDQCLSLY